MKEKCKVLSTWFGLGSRETNYTNEFIVNLEKISDLLLLVLLYSLIIT